VSLSGFLWLTGSSVTLAAAIIWGLISAKMQAKPGLMMTLGVLITVFGAAQQFRLSLPAPTISNNPNAVAFILQMREIFSIIFSVFLSMEGALMGCAVSLKAARLYAEESRSIMSMLEDEELYIEELRAQIADSVASSDKPNQGLVNQLARATDRLEKIEDSAKKLGIQPKHRKKRRPTGSTS